MLEQVKGRAMNTNFYIKRPFVFQDAFEWEAYKGMPVIRDIPAIEQTLKKDGLCVFSFDPDKGEKEVINGLAKALKIEQPFVSSDNKKYHSNSFVSNINYIGSPNHNSKHVVFDKSTGQGFHVDGTFEDIGTVKTTILCCLNPAFHGGESIFFHATKAFEFFQKKHPDMAELFCLPDALRRFNFGYEHEREREKIGPAFAYVDGQLMTRFTIDGSADWEYGFKRIDGLREAFLLFQQFYALDSPYIKIVKLEKNQGVIFSNSLISHGRLAFENRSDIPRVYCRGLFEGHIL